MSKLELTMLLVIGMVMELVGLFCGFTIWFAVSMSKYTAVLNLLLVILGTAYFSSQIAEAYKEGRKKK